MKNNLVIGLLGHRNSGKSKTWYELFGENVKTSSNVRKLFLTPTEFVQVFLISQSPEERDIHISKIIGGKRPRIILCSMQYITDVNKTIDFFVNNDYFLYIQWLNPGHNDKNDIPYDDYSEIVKKILSLDSTVSIRNSKRDLTERVQEIRDYLYGWAANRNLLLTSQLS